MDELTRRAVAVDAANRALGAEALAVPDATFVRDRRLPDIYDANHVAAVRAADPHAVDALLAAVEREYAHCRHRQFVLDPETPTAFEARLVHEGYGVEQTLVMVLEGPLGGRPRPHPIRPVADESDWAAYARLKRLDWVERATRLGLGDLPAIGEGLIAHYRAKVPPLRYWLALADGRPRGFFSSWEGPDGVGQVEDLFVEEPFRHRGLGTALLHHAVADARAHGAGPVAIVAEPTETPKAMYAAMGFRPVAVVRKYTKT
jgi:GNAT superfamily N-acetyltransferase